MFCTRQRSRWQTTHQRTPSSRGEATRRPSSRAVRPWQPALSPFLTGRMFVSPNILRTLRRTMIRFLISPNMVRTVQTLLHSQLACNGMEASARTCGRRAVFSKIENVGSSRQYTFIIPHRVIEVTTISFWVSQTRLLLPQVNK